MDRKESILNEIAELESRIDFLQEVQAEDSQEQGNSDNNDSPSWPTITNQMS